MTESLLGLSTKQIVAMSGNLKARGSGKTKEQLHQLKRFA